MLTEAQLGPALKAEYTLAQLATLMGHKDPKSKVGQQWVRRRLKHYNIPIDSKVRPPRVALRHLRKLPAFESHLDALSIDG